MALVATRSFTFQINSSSPVVTVSSSDKITDPSAIAYISAEYHGGEDEAVENPLRTYVVSTE